MLNESGVSPCHYADEGGRNNSHSLSRRVEMSAGVWPVRLSGVCMNTGTPHTGNRGPLEGPVLGDLP